MSRFIILSVISVLLCGMPLSAQQRSGDKKKAVAVQDTVPFFQGLAVSVDAVGPGAYLFGGDFMSMEAALEVNLKNRFFPILEVGYGETDATNEDTELHYRTSAPYFRLGMNYNTQYKKQLPGYIYAGFRVGYTRFEYDVDGPALEDPIWGGESAFSFSGISGHALWGELLAGVKVNVYKNLMMGWSFRYKVRMSASKGENASPWYIPGYGANGSTKFGVSYDLIYRIPWKKKQPREKADKL